MCWCVNRVECLDIRPERRNICINRTFSLEDQHDFGPSCQYAEKAFLLTALSYDISISSHVAKRATQSRWSSDSKRSMSDTWQAWTQRRDWRQINRLLGPKIGLEAEMHTKGHWPQIQFSRKIVYGLQGLWVWNSFSKAEEPKGLTTPLSASDA